jgi:hypothetical protein
LGAGRFGLSRPQIDPAPTPWFANKVVEAGVQLSDFGRDATEEVVLLTRNSRKEPPWWEERTPRKVHREPIDYTDTPETQRYRDAIRHLNRFLSGADRYLAYYYRPAGGRPEVNKVGTCATKTEAFRMVREAHAYQVQMSWRPAFYH